MAAENPFAFTHSHPINARLAKQSRAHENAITHQPHRRFDIPPVGQTGAVVRRWRHQTGLCGPCDGLPRNGRFRPRHPVSWADGSCPVCECVSGDRLRQGKTRLIVKYLRDRLSVRRSGLASLRPSDANQPCKRHGFRQFADHDPFSTCRRLDITVRKRADDPLRRRSTARLRSPRSLRRDARPPIGSSR